MTPPAAAATTGRTLLRSPAPRKPRRVSGPAPQNRARPTPNAPRTRRAAGAAPAPDPFIVRAIERTIRMADSKFLDRLIRGRLWIPLVAAGLMGIVFMQVSMLKLNAGIGRAVQASQTLERQNSVMRAQVSGMEAGSRIDETARQIGMVAPAATTTPSYVTTAGAAQAAAAAKHMTAPDPDALARAKAATQAAIGTTTAATTTSGAPATGVATSGVATTTDTASTATGTTGTATTAATTQAPVTQAQTQTEQTPVAQPQTQTPVAQTQTPTQAQTQTQAPAASGTTVAPTAEQQTASTSGGAVAPPAG